MNYLVNSEYEALRWGEPFPPNLVRIRIPLDGSCFFHAIARSYFKPYITGKLDSKPFNKIKFIRELRKSLAVKLGSKISPTSELTYYETLSRGQLPEIARTMPAFSLKSLQEELDSSRSVGNIYNEFISDQLDKDIYILDGSKRDVYMTGNDDEILYKSRPSIVLLFIPQENQKGNGGHYELVGEENNGIIKVLFEPTDNLTETIRNRMLVLRS